MVFDDAKLHLGFNHSKKHRTVLIFDVMRPEGFRKGTIEARETHPEEFESFI